MDDAERARLNAAIDAESDPKRKAELKKEFIALFRAAKAAVDAPHKALYEELKGDIDDYVNYSGTSEIHKTFPISPKLAASVARWPKVTEELVVYRGQSKKHLKLPGAEKAFLSATDGLNTAREFAGKGGNIFKITLKPGVRFLKTYGALEGGGEQEVFVATDGVVEYGDEKVRVEDKGMLMRNMAIPVTIYPKPEGGRRTRRRLTRRRLTRRRRNV